MQYGTPTKRRHVSTIVMVMAVLLLILSVGTNAGPNTAGPVTLIAVQMQITPADYESTQTFASLVDRYMQAASKHFGPGHNLVAFPEDVGLGLVFLNHCDAFAQGLPSIWLAAGYIATMYYGPELQTLWEAHPELQTRFARSLLLVRGDEIRRVYYKTFSEAARKYHVTLIAGSAPIPGPNLDVYNTCYIFDPNGKLAGAQRKVHLDTLEQAEVLDLTSGSISDIAAVDTPAGRIGVAICLDAFYQDVIDRLVSQGARTLVQPSFNARVWDDWQAEDWLRGMWTSVRDHTELVAGVNPMMVGGLWEIQVQGMSSIVARGYRPPAYGYAAQASDPASDDVISTTIFVTGPR